MNFFVRPPKMEKIKSSYIPEVDIVHYVRQDKLVKVNIDDKGNVDQDDFIIDEIAVESERVNRREYINSFREDVGIANILKKVALSGDVSLFNQVQRVKLPTDENGLEPIQDATILQEGEEKIALVGDQMRKTYAGLPKELTKGRSVEKFLDEVDQKEIAAFVEKMVAAKIGGKKDGE